MSKGNSSPALHIGATERGLLVGQTGSGKSTLANILLLDKKNLFVLDPKGNFELSRKHTICHNPDEIEEAEKKYPGRAILYRPSPQYSSIAELDNIYRWIYLRGSTFLYIDEATATVGRSSLSYPESLRSLFTQGRGLGVGVLVSTQRPSNLPLYMFSESNKFWKFFLLLRKDQERMAEWMGSSIREPPDFPSKSRHSSKFSFFYRDISMRLQPSREYSISEKMLKEMREIQKKNEDEKDT
jgi:ABC-type oligopeptide transport system ATPase subunit